MMWKTKGMNQDLSVSAFNSEFAFENKNLRLATNDGNTTLSWVNEKGTQQLTLIDDTPSGTSSETSTGVIQGIPIGTAVLNHKLVIFTTLTAIDSTGEAKQINPDSGFIDEPVIDDNPGGNTGDTGGTGDTGNTGSDNDNPGDSTEPSSDDTGNTGGEGADTSGEASNTPGDDSSESTPVDFIYLLEPIESTEDALSLTLLYSGNLKFDVQHPLETLVSYESSSVQKVYWTDGKRQPRVINVTAENTSYTGTSFDFIPELKLNEKVYIKKQLSGGNFAPGVIQYLFTYYNKYGQESNIFYTSPLLYVSYRDRGASPEDTGVENSFSITIDGVDNEHFDYLRIYSIQRTSLNAVPLARRVHDILIKGIDGTSVAYTDTGYSGDTIDPTELLYKGGNSVIAQTMEQKDGVLFLGNITLDRKNVELDKNLKNSVYIESSTRTFKPTKAFSGSYAYSNQLTSTNSDKTTSVPCGGFKTGDWYRLGIQFQNKVGKWSDPVWIKDMEETQLPKADDGGIVNVTVPVFKGYITQSEAENLKGLGYLRMRGVVVFPEVQDRLCISQGVINPTLYTAADNPASNSNAKGIFKKIQPSWFFRTKQSTFERTEDGTVAPYCPISSNMPYDSLIYGGYNSTLANMPAPTAMRQAEIQGSFSSDNQFHLTSLYTSFYSPDIEFDPTIQTVNFREYSYRSVGGSVITKTLSDINIQTESPQISSSGSGIIHKSFDNDGSYGIVSGLFYEDFLVADNGDNIGGWERENSSVKYLIYPWQKQGSLNNDIIRPSGNGVQSAVLKRKVISNLRFAELTTYVRAGIQALSDIDIFYGGQSDIVKVGTALYHGNVDTMLMPDSVDGTYFMFDGLYGNFADSYRVTNFNASQYWWKTWAAVSSADASTQTNRRLVRYNGQQWEENGTDIGDKYGSLLLKKESVRMKYKSPTHLIFNNPQIALWNENNKVPVVEICQSKPDTIFGGTSDDALRENVWLPCGEPVRLDSTTDSIYVDAEGHIVKSSTPGAVKVQVIPFEYSYGDTYYQRYDCLKTYAYSPDDENQVIEIGSFMLETRVNIDGRYDRNRGQQDNTNMSPLNFNLMNLVYSQRDNFFNYRIQDADYYKSKSYPNQITWTLVKESGAEIDAWTNVNLGSVLELDGDKGSISKLIRYNDQLLAFQDKGISQILYNENVQIASTTGVPIEIANSQKVEGKRYLSDSIGCTNKWSLVSTPAGIYFMDSNNKGIYQLSDSLKNISLEQGFNSWSKNNIQAGKIWNPYDFDSFVAYYDKQNQDVLFINRDYCLAFSEKFGVFSSFYSYEAAPYFINYKDVGLWLNRDKGNADSKYHIYKHNGGNYCEFFGKSASYYMHLIGNPEPLVDKTFTNLEFRACVDGEGASTSNLYTPYTPFDLLQVDNEYQKGELRLEYKHGLGRMQHYHRETSEGEMIDSSSPLNRKFRIWRCDIPRNNKGGKPLDRMRNTWLKVKLTKTLDTDHRVEIHDMVMTYYV